MKSNPELKLMIRLVSNFEIRLHSLHEMQCHPGYLTSMLTAISDGQA